MDESIAAQASRLLSGRSRSVLRRQLSWRIRRGIKEDHRKIKKGSGETTDEGEAKVRREITKDDQDTTTVAREIAKEERETAKGDRGIAEDTTRTQFPTCC